jgi:WhiB family redox-sensing transcriptional regulator
VFFPHDGDGVERARAICAECAVIDCCLDFALTNHISFGVWGGESERARQRIARRRRAK